MQFPRFMHARVRGTSLPLLFCRPPLQLPSVFVPMNACQKMWALSNRLARAGSSLQQVDRISSSLGLADGNKRRTATSKTNQMDSTAGSGLRKRFRQRKQGVLLALRHGNYRPSFLTVLQAWKLFPGEEPEISMKLINVGPF